MFKLLPKKVFLFLLFIIILFLFNNSILADVNVSNLGSMSFQNDIRFETDEPFSDAQYLFNMEYKDDIYYISYLKDVSSYRQNFIAYSTDLITWTETQLTSDSSDKNLCHLYLDVDFDLICIKQSESNPADEFKYFFMASDSSTWSASTTTLDVGNASAPIYTNYGRVIKKWNAYIWLHAFTNLSYTTVRTYQLDFEDGSYSVLFVGGGTGNYYENVSSILNGFWAKIITKTSGGSATETRDFIGTTSTDDVIWTQETGYNFNLDITNSTMPYFRWIYFNQVSEDIYLFFANQSVATDTQKLYYTKYSSGVWETPVELIFPYNSTHNNTFYFQMIDLIEGENYIWGVYRTSESVTVPNPRELWRFKIAKSNMSVVENIQIANNKTNISAIGHFYGEKNLNQQSSNILITDNLMFTYVEDTTSCAPASTCEKILWFYQEVVDDQLQERVENVSLACVYDYDCWAKFGANWYCEAGTCVVLGTTDANYTSGDFAYEVDRLLEEVGFRSVASKIFIAICIILFLDVVIACILLSVTHSQISMSALGIILIVVTGLGLFMTVYMGLLPIWIVILLIIIAGGIMFSIAKGGST